MRVQLLSMSVLTTAVWMSPGLAWPSAEAPGDRGKKVFVFKLSFHVDLGL